MRKSSVLVRIGHLEPRTHERTINKNRSNLLQLILRLDIPLLVFLRELFHTTQQTLDQRRLWVDLEHLLPLRVFVHRVLSLAVVGSTHHALDVGGETTGVGYDGAGARYESVGDDDWIWINDGEYTNGLREAGK